MDSCIINLQNNPKLSSLIDEITEGDNGMKFQFSQMVEKEFQDFVKKDKTASKYEFDKIPKNTMRRLLKEFYNSKYFNVSNNSRVKQNTGLYAFKNLEAYNAGVQFAADTILGVYNLLNSEDARREDLIPQLKGKVGRMIKKNMAARLKAYGGNFDMNSNVEDMIAFAYDKKNNVKEQDKNFADLLASVQDITFWSEAFNNSKIVNLGIRVTDQDQLSKENEMLDEDEDGFQDSEQADEVDLSTRQWDFGQVNNYTKLISEEIKMYFNTLQRLNSTTKFPNGRYDVNRANPLGVPTYHTYQECIIELTELIRNGGWKSLSEFINAIREMAGRKSEFAAFAKVADDMTNNPDLAAAIYRDVNKYLMDVVEIDISDNGVISTRVVNNNNRPAIKMYLNMRNDLKATALSQTDRGRETVERIKRLVDKTNSWFKTNGDRYRRNLIPADDKSLIEMQSRLAEATELLKTVYKMYFPSMDVNSLDKFIKHNENQDIYGNTLGNNIYVLANRIGKIASLSLEAAATYSSQQFARNEARKANKPAPVYQTFFSSTMEDTLGDIATSITPYVRSQAELNFRNISNNLQSAVMYNSYLTNLVKILSDESTLQSWVEDIMQNPAEYAYSSIIMDRPEEGIRGLVRKEGERYVPSPYAQYLIHVYLLNGITDGNNGKSYTSMSDADYMLTAFHLFTGQLNEYRQYDTRDPKRRKRIQDAQKTTRPFLLKTPSDAPKNFAITMPTYSAERMVDTGTGRVNMSNPIAKILRRTVIGEIQEYVLARQTIEQAAGNRERTRMLIDNYHTGGQNALHIMKLDNSVFNVEDAILDLIRSEYENGTLSVDMNGQVVMSQELTAAVNDAVSKWIQAYWQQSVVDFNNIVGEIKRDENEIRNFMFNQYIATLAFDDLFTGNAKYYKDAQTVLKREKQTQAGGVSYGASFGITEHNSNPLMAAINNTGDSINVGGRQVNIRSGWNAILIKNTQRGSSNRNILYDQLIRAGVSKERARQLAEPFGYNEDEVDGNTSEDFYENGTKVNDAQSYITIYEAARRLKLLGLYGQYEKLLNQLTDETTDLNDINPAELSSFIQVFKNFYFDHYYDPALGRHVSRQIKNAEFVLVPKFLGDSSLGRLARMMIENDIDQVNTQETSKAVNYDVLEYWDKDGVAPENLEQFTKDAIATKKPFNYLYLYRQQEVPQHMLDAQNKAGIQIMKKAIDNLTKGLVSERVSTAKDNFLRAYVTNIQESFNELMDKFGVKFDKYGNIMPSGKKIDYTKIWNMARAEVARLGRDSNMMDYFTIKNENTNETVMPSFFNVNSSKVENIAQALFNNNITRQKLRGWHAAQVSSVGFDHLIPQLGHTEASQKLGKRIELQYHKENNVVEILLPKWASNMFNKYDAEGKLVQEISIEDLDEDVKMCIGYRI